MTIRRTELELREDRKLKSTLYNHPSTRQHIAERDAGRTKGDDTRRKHADEKGALGQKLHKESVELTHRHRMERDRHDAGSVARPIEMEKRHAAELAAMNRDHDGRRREMAKRHRRELDQVED
jgi:hypothetical protein